MGKTDKTDQRGGDLIGGQVYKCIGACVIRVAKSHAFYQMVQLINIGVMRWFNIGTDLIIILKAQNNYIEGNKAKKLQYITTQIDLTPWKIITLTWHHDIYL